MSKILSRFERSLDGLARRDRKRKLLLNDHDSGLLDFSSNDYLGLSKHPKMLEAVRSAIDSGVAVGSGGSRLLGGHHIEHEGLERYATQYFGAQSCLFFANGFMANYALLTCLPKSCDLIIFDELVHASIHDGMSAGKAQTISAMHNDPQDFEDKIYQARQKGFTGQLWIVIESIYSMDGDQAPLAELVAIADKYEGFLVIDEAHATGVWGRNGKGLAAEWESTDNIIILHTCGKAVGVSGALLCMPKLLRDYMLNFSRPFIFSTAPSPLTAYSVLTALKIMDAEPELRMVLHKRIKLAHGLFAKLGYESSDSQIQPIIIGDAGKTMEKAIFLQNNGFDVRGVRPPTVPDGSSRLRITINAQISEKNITDLAAMLGEVN